MQSFSDDLANTDVIAKKLDEIVDTHASNASREVGDKVTQVENAIHLRITSEIRDLRADLIESLHQSRNNITQIVKDEMDKTTTLSREIKKLIYLVEVGVTFSVIISFLTFLAIKGII